MANAVQTTVEDEIGRLRLNQPDRRNAWSPALLDGLVAGMDELEDADARVLVLEAAGEAFCAGGDIDMMEGWDESSFEDRVDRATTVHREVIARLIRFPLPTIAKIDGAAIGGGATLAVACDLQVASERARLGFSFRTVGLCIDSGTSYVLSRQVGENTAKDLVYTGRVVDGREAANLGLVTHVHPVDAFQERAEALVSTVATGPTVALRLDKRLLTGAAERSLSDALDAEAMAMARAAGTADHREGVAAFREGRDPDFEGR